MAELTRAEWDELRQATADELFYDVRGSEPEQADERLKYVTIQIDRELWLRIRAIPGVAEVLTREAYRKDREFIGSIVGEDDSDETLTDE